jgi:hypothetical protein
MDEVRSLQIRYALQLRDTPNPRHEPNLIARRRANPSQAGERAALNSGSLAITSQI